jgi:vacuolar-type H+-ATPase catalytic subunit A/Vma1
MREAVAGHFRFTPGVRVGDRIGPGAVVGEVTPAAGEAAAEAVGQRCLVPPDAAGGEVVELAEGGVVAEDVPVCTLRTDDGGTEHIALFR